MAAGTEDRTGTFAVSGRDTLTFKRKSTYIVASSAETLRFNDTKHDILFYLRLHILSLKKDKESSEKLGNRLFLSD